MVVKYMSDLESGRLLIFLGFGITLLIFSLSSKMSISINNSNNKEYNRLQRYADVYRFIKTIFNWGILYFIAAIFILLSTLVSFSENFFRPILYNIGFFITLIWTIFLTLVYIRLVLFGLLQDMILGNRYNLDT
jgi:hypothetical protein